MMSDWWCVMKRTLTRSVAALRIKSLCFRLSLSHYTLNWKQDELGFFPSSSRDCRHSRKSFVTWELGHACEQYLAALRGHFYIISTWERQKKSKEEQAPAGGLHSHQRPEISSGSVQARFSGSDMEKTTPQALCGAGTHFQIFSIQKSGVAFNSRKSLHVV